MFDVKFAICQWSLPGNGMYGPKLAKEAGYDGIQLDLGTYERGLPMTQKRIQECLLEDGEKYGIEYPSLVINEVCNYTLTKLPEESEDAKIAYEMMRRGVQAAADMGIGVLMMPSFFESYVNTPRELENTVKAFRYCCELAGEKGIEVYSESILSPERQMELIAKVGLPNLHVFYDTQNYESYTFLDQMDMVKAFYPYMGTQFHIKDGSNQTSNKLVGEGDGNVQAQLDYIKEHGFKGWIITENYYDRLPLRKLNEDDMLDIARRDLEIMKKAVQ